MYRYQHYPFYIFAHTNEYLDKFLLRFCSKAKKKYKYKWVTVPVPKTKTKSF